MQNLSKYGLRSIYILFNTLLTKRKKEIIIHKLLVFFKPMEKKNLILNFLTAALKKIGDKFEYSVNIKSLVSFLVH